MEPLSWGLTGGGLSLEAGFEWYRLACFLFLLCFLCVMSELPSPAPVARPCLSRHDGLYPSTASCKPKQSLFFLGRICLWYFIKPAGKELTQLMDEADKSSSEMAHCSYCSAHRGPGTRQKKHTSQSAAVLTVVPWPTHGKMECTYCMLGVGDFLCDSRSKQRQSNRSFPERCQALQHHQTLKGRWLILPPRMSKGCSFVSCGWQVNLRGRLQNTRNWIEGFVCR